MTPGSRRLSVGFTASSPHAVPLPGANVVVLDVLRATTVLPIALAAGAARIVPLATEEEARSLRRGPPPVSGIWCGERDGLRIPGFDLGNSPSEYTPERVGGQTLYYLSTNGAPGILQARSGALLVAASFVNAGAAIAALGAEDRPVLLLAAGNQGHPSLEDVACAGFLASRLHERDPAFRLDDGAVMAILLWQAWEHDVRGLLAKSRHGAYLASLGFAGDLDTCSRIDSVPVVPVFRDGALVPLLPDS